MRSRHARVLEVEKSRTALTTPKYLEFGQRHLEKSMPEGKKAWGGISFTIPVDLIRLSTKDEESVKDVEEVTLVYKEAGA